MQSWSESQSQSKILNVNIVLILITVSLISISPQVFGDEQIGTIIKEDVVVFEVGKFEDVQVQHVIKSGVWSENNPKFLQILLGEHSNLMVTDEDGDRLSFSYKETSENLKFVQLNQKAASLDLVVTYDLKNFMEKNNGMWEKHLVFPIDVQIFFDDSVGLVFLNERPIELNDAKGINCVGCEIDLKFFDDESVSEKRIEKNGEVFFIEVLSNGNIQEFEINEKLNFLNFNVEGYEQFFVLKIPLKLILNPYEVYFTEYDDESLDQVDKIRKSEFNQNMEYTKISFKTTQNGIVSIVGATQEQHEILLDKIEKRITSQVESEFIEKKAGVPLPLPGTGVDLKGDNVSENNNRQELSFADELMDRNNNSEEDLENNSIVVGIFLFIVIVIVIIIVGIIVKRKKN